MAIQLIDVKRPPKLEMDYLNSYIKASTKFKVQKLNKKLNHRTMSETVEYIIINFFNQNPTIAK
jgi:hypothetical protein